MNITKKVHISDTNITLDKITYYEYAEIISNRIRDIGKGSEVRLDISELTIPIDEYDGKVSKKGKEIFEDGNKFYIVEDSTYHIAKIELNKDKCPYLILRVLKETDTDVYAELINPNGMIKPI